MKILGIDPATKSGFALYDPDKPFSAIRAWTVTMKGKTDEQKAVQAGLVLVQIIKQHRPDFIALEAPLKNIVAHKKTAPMDARQAQTFNPASVILPNQIVGAMLGVIGGFDMPWDVIAVTTWRKQFLGFARKPGFDRKAWKWASRQRCDNLNIAVTNDDMADAVGVAFAAQSSSVFKMLCNRMEAT